MQYDAGSLDGDLIGKKLAHFRLLAKIGQGGMGVVYAAEDERLNRAVALKVLREDYVGDETRRQRFMREARSAAAVTHANIATVHEVGEADGMVYIAMELIEGQSLRQLLAAQTLSIREALRIAKEIARGVARAHDKGIVHRDLKPDNVMVSDDGQVKVLDFGVAKSSQGGDAVTHDEAPAAKARAGPDAPQPNVTDTGQLVGTPAYMSPEQALGSPIDARSDLYSFGVMLYEMVTGARPFANTSAIALLMAVARETPPRPSIKNPLVTPDLEAVIARCMEKKPDDRYAGMREALVELEIVDSAQASGIALPTLEAQTTALSGAIAPPVKRQRMFLHALGVLAGVLVLYGILRVVRSPSTPAIATPSASSSSPPNLPSAMPTALTDLPAPQTSVPSALGVYKTALHAFRDGNFEEFDLGMREAVRLDPSFAAGELRLAFAKFHSVRGAVTDGRSNLELASRLRASLSEHDQILLDVLEPVISREPPDSDEMERRLRAAVARFPLDAEFLYLLAGEERRYDIEKSIATYDRVLAVDPDFMMAVRQKAQTLVMRGAGAEARRLLDDCLRRAPTATGCRNERIWLNQDEGHCAEIEPDARQMIAADPESFRGYEALARAAVALGRPPEAIAEALSQAWRRAPAEVRARDEILTNARLAALAGRFADAMTLGAKYDAAIATDSAASVHAGAASLLVEINLEIGDVRAAARVAQAFRRRQEVWSGSPDAVTPRMLKVEALAGTIDLAAMRGERAAFLDEWGRESTRVRFVRGMQWIHAFAAQVESKADADEAMNALATYAPIPIGQRTALNDEALGRTRFFAGNVADAVTSLGRAARMCVALDEPFRHVRAHLVLGRALEAKGDTAAACDAYRVVVASWGSAQPRSTSAAFAKDRLRALACSR